MGTITGYSSGGGGVKNVSETTLTASDTFTFLPGAGQILRLRNVTAGALTVLITGSAAVAVTFPRGGSVNYAAGYSTGSIPATTGDVEIALDTIADYLQGTITVTGGTGIKAALRNP